MIQWTPGYPKYLKPRGYARLVFERIRYNEYYGLTRRGIRRKKGYQDKIASWKDKYKDRRCFVIGNGPSLKKMDLSFMKDEITIASNAFYKLFDELGFSTSYLLFEDVEQTEIRGPEVHAVKGPIKMAALYNAYAIKPDKDTVYFNAPRPRNYGYYWRDPYFPQFSTDFAGIVHLGSTVTYIGMQLAYHLGCKEVYLIGVDHNYGKLPELFPPGKITITEENIELIRECHFSTEYYKVGDQIGVPFSKMQEQAYQCAADAFQRDGRQIMNAGVDSKLEIFPKVRYQDLFTTS